MHPGGATTPASPPAPVLDVCPASAGLPEALPPELLLEPAPAPEPLLDPEPPLEPLPVAATPLPAPTPAEGVDPLLDEPPPVGAAPALGADVPPVAGPLPADAPLELLDEPPAIVWMASLPDDEPPPAAGLEDWLAGWELQALQALATSKSPTRCVWARRFMRVPHSRQEGRGFATYSSSARPGPLLSSRRANRAILAARTSANKRRRSAAWPPRPF